MHQEKEDDVLAVEAVHLAQHDKHVFPFLPLNLKEFQRDVKDNQQGDVFHAFIIAGFVPAI